jgi:PPE-repeat protein
LSQSTALRWLERAAWLLDDAIRVPILNRRIGLDPLIGLIPGAGDTVAALMAATTLLSALKHGVPGVTIARMGVNIALDYLIGLVPLLGDLGDFAFKANRRNLELLRRHALAKRKASAGDYLVVGGVALGLGGLFVGGIWLMLQVLRLLLRSG